MGLVEIPLRPIGVFLAVWCLLFAGVFARAAGGAGALLRLLAFDLREGDRRRCWISAGASLAIAAGVAAFF